MTTCKAEVLEVHTEYGFESMHLNLKIHQMHFFLLITMNLVQRVNQTNRYALKILFFGLCIEFQKLFFLRASRSKHCVKV